jgi:uncharacterized protein with PhoU and TrkA domain
MKEIEDKFLELKEKAELMVDLAYSSLLYDNRAIAREVYHLENEVDKEHEELQRIAIEGVLEDEDVDKALLYVRLGAALEVIADSAREIADITLRDMDMHPIFQQSLRESDTVITSAIVDESSPFAGKKLRDLDLPDEYGAWIIAIKGKNGWIYGPDADDAMLPGDFVIARCPSDMEEKFVKKLGKKVDWETYEE